MGERTAADLWLEGYAREQGYSAEFEPNWSKLFGGRFENKNPDYLLDRGGDRAIAEVSEFESYAFSRYLDSIGGGGVIPPQIIQAPIFNKLKDEAEQLRPFEETGLPLIIVLANTGRSDVMLSEHEIRTAMFSDEVIVIPVARSPDAFEEPLPPPGRSVRPGYGAFLATDDDGNPVNPRPWVSAVAVIRPYNLEALWKAEDLNRHLAGAEDEEERRTLTDEWLRGPVATGEAEGPEGIELGIDLFDLNRYGNGHGAAVPDEWFRGPRDHRFGFNQTGTDFGPA